MQTPRSSAAVLLVTALFSTVVLTGCGERSDLATSNAQDTQEVVPTGGEADGQRASSVTGEGQPTEKVAAQRAPAAVTQRAVIATATISLDSTDVRKSRNAVQLVVDTLDGEVSDEEATTDDGELSWTRMVLRIPTENYDEAIGRLEEAGRLVETSRSTEDVTTQVIDNEVRIRAQERSLKRVEILLDRAERIADVVSVESELTRRQAELDSLKQQQAWLSDQTSMATVTVHIDQRTRPQKLDEESAGFLSGLATGWKTLSGAAVALSTVAGVLLPWLFALGLLAFPFLWGVRRLSRSGRQVREHQANG